MNGVETSHMGRRYGARRLGLPQVGAGIGLAAAVLLASCGGGDGVVTGEDVAAPDVAPDVAAPPDVDRDAVVSFDLSAPDMTEETQDVDPEADVASADATGGFGDPCRGNADCETGWCVEGVSGYVCTSQCLETCPDGYDCRSVQSNGGDVIFLCLPRVQKVCTPCLEDFQCNGGACLDIDGQSRCASRCETTDECPVGYACEADPAGAEDGLYCVPRSGSCDCTPAFDGVQRTCTRTNGLGTCLGFETCDGELGWVGCDAREPAPETCNYVDDDCSGGVDDTFKDEGGVYADAAACGSCTTDCSETVPNATETACVVAGGVARCQVVTCETGYVPLNEFVCVPDAGNLCQPCEVDAECAGVGARCVTLDDGRFCGRACEDVADCAEGFVCETLDGGSAQCVPASGSCTCDGSNTNLARACSVSYTPPGPNAPVVTCQGFEQCTSEGWGACQLPSEVCDGADNDCDGTVDEDYRTGDKYTALEHCGACRVNCASLNRANAEPICDTEPAVPVCGYVCAGDAVDVDGLSDNGCECVPAAGPDLAGDGVDSNCDGIDGEVALGVFVSRDGAPGNPGTRELPVLSIGAGLALAASEGKRDVYVATGVYSENVALVDGVGLFGGYAPFFDERSPVLYETAIIGQAPTVARPGTVTGIGVGVGSGATVVDGFTVFGPNAANLPGVNSYAIYLRDAGAGLRVSNNRVFAGPGGPGSAGASGSNGQGGVDGADGLDAKNTAGCPPATGSTGGLGGSRTCEGTNVSGGNGGSARCPNYEAAPASSAAGADGRGALRGSGGSAGWDMFVCQVSGSYCEVEGGLAPKNCGSCYLPPDDEPFDASSGTAGGAGADGTRGLGCSAPSGSVVDGHWTGGTGATGANGTHGAGGGGGGAGGGVEAMGTTCTTENGDDDVGGSGGGGGSGGCRALGGTGGTAGGGSFGVFYVRTVAGDLPVVRDNALTGGTGGPGGAGGPGGVGGTGGSGGSGGAAGNLLSDNLARCAAGGGQGGAGGRGGHGGGGGGGCGGASYALFVSLVSGSPPAAWKTGNTFPAGGVGGQGGGGGPAVVSSSAGTGGAVGAAATANF